VKPLILVARRRLFRTGLLAVLIAAAVAARPSAAVPPAVYRGAPDRRAVAFACNVVWGDPYVLPIAQAFRQAGMRATFFLGGAFAKDHPELMRALVSLGMELGNHGWGHRHVGELSLAANEAEIERAAQAIFAATGVRTTLYEPAYGELSRAVLAAAAALHHTVVLWTIDTVDWRSWHTPDIIRARVLDRLEPGAIILIHPTPRTLAALPGILSALRQRGYTAVTVSELLRPPN
jgi:peptidoglycan/xylan/chitin deacetylase (PgdA/CDA1 family)